MHFYKIIRAMAISMAFTMAVCSVNVAAQEETEESKTFTTTTAVSGSEITAEEKVKEETTTETTTKSEKSAFSKNTSKKTDSSKKKNTSQTEKTITQKSVKKLEESNQKEEKSDSVEIIPKIYNDHSLSMKGKKETINGFIYFNQGDAAWNDNGYRIKQAGCGPTSMAVVISSLTGKWVTPVDTTVWAYEHGYYSGQGSVHGLIPALAKEYGLNCKGVGTDEDAIREALQEENPVVCLMGPGYFTKGGHFMVLVGIDEDDNVTVADVGSRERSKYKYQLTDIISQSKAASAGGPFWIISKEESDVNGNQEFENKEDILQAEAGNTEFEAMKDVDETTIKETVQSGIPVMMISDKKIIKNEEFIYILAINSNGLATVTDRNFEKQEQFTFTDLMSHAKTDMMGISFWQVTSETEQFLMPFSQTNMKNSSN